MNGNQLWLRRIGAAVVLCAWVGQAGRLSPIRNTASGSRTRGGSRHCRAFAKPGWQFHRQLGRRRRCDQLPVGGEREWWRLDADRQRRRAEPGLSGKPTGSYGYRAQACNDAGCGPYSGVVTVTVIQPPATPGLSVPASSTTGSYTVSWNAVAMAVNYPLEQTVNGGGWALIQNDGSAQRAQRGPGHVCLPRAGLQCGRVQWLLQCREYLRQPAATPTITFSAKYQWKQGTATKIRCDHQWTASPGATRYDFTVPENGWVQYSGASTQISLAGAGYCAPTHVVRACNHSGCSAYSSPPTVQGFVDLDNPQ